VSSRTRRFVLRAALAALVICIVAFFARETLLAAVGRQLVRADPLTKADAIVVLGGGTPQREIEAADLYLAHYAPRVVMALEEDSDADALLRKRGVTIETRNELRQRILRSLGVPDSAVTVLHETRPVSTRMESDVVRRWVLESGSRRIIVVSSAFHTARASFVFRRVLRNDSVEVLVRPASYEAFDSQKWWTDHVQLKNGVVELQKLLFYYVVYWWD
jgi:uncharacterized SAM-binding protein YcdF (DUF218 family)